MKGAASIAIVELVDRDVRPKVRFLTW